MKAFRSSGFPKLIEVMRIKGVRVLFHWSVLVIGAIILLGAAEDAPAAFTVLACYYGTILIHECGHLFAAQRKGCFVSSIELYPLWGITRFTPPYSLADRCVIAWGGVAAQAFVAAPLILWVETFGYSRFPAINAAFAILGFFSLGVAAFNLLPVHPLDGATAWRLLPALFKRAMARSTKHEPGWRSWR